MKAERIKREIEDLRYYGGLLTIAAANVFKLANDIEIDIEEYEIDLDSDSAKRQIRDRVKRYIKDERPKDLDEVFLDEGLSCLLNLCD